MIQKDLNTTGSRLTLSGWVKDPCDVPHLQVAIFLRQLLPWLAEGASMGLNQAEEKLVGSGHHGILEHEECL